MEAICSPKRRFELELHGTRSHKISIIDTAVKASQKTVLLDHTRFPSTERLINSDSTVTQLWNPIIPRNNEDGGDMFSETSVRTRDTRQKAPQDVYNLYRRESITEDSALEP
jgi:hypothetical protein